MYPDEADIDDRTLCRGCGKPLLAKNYRIADGCPCNSPRGVNHGVVPTLTCTCSARGDHQDAALDPDEVACRAPRAADGFRGPLT